MQGEHDYTISLSESALIQLRSIITASSAKSILLEFINKMHLHRPVPPSPKKTPDKKEKKKNQQNTKPDQQVDGRMGMKWPPGSHHTSCGKAKNLN